MQDPKEVDDQFRALLEGLRTTIPGVIVLFAFLLSLPLQSLFAEMSLAQLAAYYIAFASCSIALILLIAPSVHQRVRAPISGIRRNEISHVMTAAWLAIVGTFTFVLTISAVVYLVTSLVMGSVWAVLATVVATLLSLATWAYVPLRRFEKGEDT